MRRVSIGFVTAIALLMAVITMHGSSHREALSVLNEPCADNTDTYAWVSDATHNKLYLIMDFYPLHEPGQGNQGLRACRNYAGAGQDKNAYTAQKHAGNDSIFPLAADCADCADWLRS